MQWITLSALTVRGVDAVNLLRSALIEHWIERTLYESGDESRMYLIVSESRQI